VTPDPPVGLNMRMAGAALDVTGRCLTRLPRRAKASAAVVLGWVLWRCEIHRPPPFPALFPDGAPAALRGRLRSHFMRRAMALFNLAEAVWGEPGRVLAQVSVTGWPDILALQRRGVPVILLGAHFIDLPLPIRVLAERVPIGLVARMFRHPLAQQPLAALARRTGGSLIDGEDPRAICRSLRRGETVLILADYPQSAASPTATDRIERLARTTGAVVLPLLCRRIDGRSWLAVGAPLGRGGLNDEALRALFAGWIAEAPIDYLWPRIAEGVPAARPSLHVGGGPRGD
jgi:lauroyl/myristoyl acyltransferase